MPRKIIFVTSFFTFVFSLFLANVVLASAFAVPLPKVPADFYVRLDSDGGMVPKGFTIEIKGTEGTYEKYDNAEKQTASFSLTKKELAQLWATFQKNNFRGIRTHEEDIYDRGGVSITRTANGNTVTKSDSGRSIVNVGSSARRFYAIVNYIQALPPATSSTSDLL